MNEIVFIINKEKSDIVKALFKKNNIPYREAGYPDGKVEVKESYNSKINIHSKMTEFSKSLGFSDTVEAIGSMGSAIIFKRKFNKYINDNM